MGDPPARMADNSSTAERSSESGDTGSVSTATTSRTNSTSTTRGPPRSIGGAQRQQRDVRTTQQQNKSGIFRGNVTAMNGNVFQLHSERRKRGQFRDTVDALKTLASTEFKHEVRYLEPLFRALEDPVVPLPIKPKGETVIDPNDSTRTITLAPDEVELDVYKAELTEYVKQKERLKQTKAALVNCDDKYVSENY